LSSGRRVLHVTQPVEGGVGQVVFDLVRDQHERETAVFVACPPDGSLPARLVELGVRRLDWHAVRSPGLRLPSELAQLRKIIRATEPQIVHLHSSKAGLVGRLLPLDAVVAFQPHAWSFQALSGGMARAAAAWERRAARRTDVIVCVSEGERATGQRAGIRGHCVVVHNGVDLTVFTPASDEDRTEARRKLGLPDVPITVCVGRLSPAKGQDILLRAWPAVRERVPIAVLYLVGAFEERDAAEGVEFVGHQESVTDWLAAADVVACPSRWEAMSLALLEAMARGRSVVASDVGGNREALGVGSGAIVPAGESRPLADAIVARLLDPDLCRGEGRTAATRSRAYDVRRTTERIFSLYEEALSRRGRV
jgi:glycosyltransferase involved in cell wall biosynthesis